MSRSSVALPVAFALALLAHLTPAAAAAQPSRPDPWFGPDKALHFALSSLITGGAYGVSTFFTEEIPVRVAFGAGAGVTAGATKELFDLAGFGDPSLRDFTWDVLGTAVGVGISVVIDITLRSSRPAAVHCPLSTERESASVSRR